MTVMKPATAAWALAATAVGLLTATGARAERYVVDAQYRSGVSKTFPDLGGGSISVAPVDATMFDVQVDGSIRHPEDRRVFRFRIDRRYRLEGRFVRIVRTSLKELNPDARPHEAELTRILPFAFLVRHLPAPDHQGDRTTTLHYAGSTYDLRYRETERQLEATLYDSNRPVGKFFLAPGEKPDRRRLARLERFRLAVFDDKLFVNFVMAGP
jgi:hypothetical protein